MRPDRLPEDALRVNGFERVRGHEHFVEWRDVGPGRVAYVWIEYEDDARGRPGWNVEYEVRRRRGSGLADQGHVASHRSEEFEAALSDAVSFMRRNGSGERETTGGLSAGADADFDFT